MKDLAATVAGTGRGSEGPAGASADLAIQNPEPSDAELERGILEALRLGLAPTAQTLTAQLDARQRAREAAAVKAEREAAGNVLELRQKNPARS